MNIRALITWHINVIMSRGSVCHISKRCGSSLICVTCASGTLSLENRAHMWSSFYQNIRIILPLLSGGSSLVNWMFAHPLQSIPLYGYSTRSRTSILSSESNKPKMYLLIALHSYYDLPLLENNSSYMCICVLDIDIGGRLWINVGLVEWHL